MRTINFNQLIGAIALGAAVLIPLQIAGAAQSDDVAQSFDSAFPAKPSPPPRHGARTPAPTPLAVPTYLSRQDNASDSDADSGIYAGPFVNPPVANVTGSGLASSALDAAFERRLLALAEGSHGRIGVAALDLSSGRSVAVLGEQPFPMASTAKVAIVATFLADVDAGRLHLGDRFPMMFPLPSAKFSSTVAPARAGEMLTGQELIERAMTLSDNHATDGLLAAIGGPWAVDRWLRGAGLKGIRLDHNINTMVRDDGVVNPATTVDVHDSTTPLTMVRLLAGLYQGNWLSPSSRDVLLGAMSRCRTGVHRMRLLLPSEALIGHKTGTLANTSSDVGFIRTPAGRTLALAIYVTGQGSKPDRESRIATIARAVYDGYGSQVEIAGVGRAQ